MYVFSCKKKLIFQKLKVKIKVKNKDLSRFQKSLLQKKNMIRVFGKLISHSQVFFKTVIKYFFLSFSDY